MTLTELLASLTADLGYDVSPASPAVTKRLTRYVNEGYRHILSMSEFSPLRSATLPFASEPTRKVYGFPQTLVQIDQIVDLTNAIRLRLMTADQFRTIDPQERSSGTPTHYVPVGMGPTLRELAVPSPLYAVSTNALDGTVTAPVVNAYAIRAGGLPSPLLQAQINGTTRVQLAVPVTTATFTDYLTVQQLQTDVGTGDRPLGEIQLWDAAVAGNLLSQIAIGQTTVQYQQIRLWPTPAGAYQYQIDGTVGINDLQVVAEDPFSDILAASLVPVLPADFHYVLCDYARMREYEYRDDSRLPMAQGQYQAKLNQMRARIIDPPDYRPRVGRIPDRSSNLGSYFPPGRW